MISILINCVEKTQTTKLVAGISGKINSPPLKKKHIIIPHPIFGCYPCPPSFVLGWQIPFKTPWRMKCSSQVLEVDGRSDEHLDGWMWFIKASLKIMNPNWISKILVRIDCWILKNYWYSSWISGHESYQIYFINSIRLRKLRSRGWGYRFSHAGGEHTRCTATFCKAMPEDVPCISLCLSPLSQVASHHQRILNFFFFVGDPGGYPNLNIYKASFATII